MYVRLVTVDDGLPAFQLCLGRVGGALARLKHGDHDGRRVVGIGGDVEPEGAVEGQGSRQVGCDQPNGGRNDGHVSTVRNSAADVLSKSDIPESRFAQLSA